MSFVSFRAHTFVLTLLVLSQTGAAWAGPNPEPTMHRALYKLRTVSSSSNSPVTQVRGTMSYEWSDACEGWVVDQRYQLEFQYRDGPTLRVKNNFLSWESKDGRDYEFKARKFVDDTLDEEIEGKAHTQTAQGLATFTAPEESEMQLTDGTLFPVAHTLALITQAHAGKRFFYKTVFDGSAVDAGSDISAVLGAPRASGIDIKRVEGDRDLLKGKVIPVVLAYFDHDDATGVPRYELTVQLHDNGVAERLLLNYGDYVLDAELAKIERMPASGC
jgi:hypothetical protein